MTDAATFARQRQTMVDCQVRTFDVTDQVLIERMAHVPREMFLPDRLKPLAYSDAVLTIPGPAPRKLLVPLVLARMIQALALKPTDKVLDVAGGCGYSAAILAGLCAQVTALESDPAMSDAARRGFAAGNLSNVTVATGPLAAGHAADAPYDAILVNGAVGTTPDALLAQLADRGRLVCIDPASGQAVRYDKVGDDVGTRRLFPTGGAVLPDFAPAPAFSL
jgi:protein-L-isoaspartate(D-aspartate) O-methyltransferase